MKTKSKVYWLSAFTIITIMLSGVGNMIWGLHSGNVGVAQLNGGDAEAINTYVVSAVSMYALWFINGVAWMVLIITTKTKTK